MAAESLCANCDAPAGDRFCPACGQRQHGRLTFGELGSEFLARFFSAERGFWLTLIEMTIRPGRTASNYLAGRRRRYLSPLLWYALCSGATVFSVWLLRDLVTGSIIDTLPPVYFEWLEQHGIDEPRVWARGRYLLLIQSAYSWLGLFTFVLPMAAVIRLVLWHRANLAESTVVSLLSVAHVMGITAITMHALLRISTTVHGTFSIGLYFVYTIVTVGNCFGWSVRSALAGVLGIVIGSASFLLTLGLLTNAVLTYGVA